MNRIIIQRILDKYQGAKYKDTCAPLLLAGYKSFNKPFPYKCRADIIGIINARAYRNRMANLMKDVINKAVNNPNLLINSI